MFSGPCSFSGSATPVRRKPNGSPVLDDQGQPIPDETEAAKAVWDMYYANHQTAGNFKHLKVLDCFMGGGTTVVEGSRLGFQVSGVDLNPVAWFAVKNELACTDPAEVKRFFDQIEAEVKPVIHPFYVTDCPRGHKGKWHELADAGDSTANRPMPVDFDPVNLPPEERKRYRYEGPEIIYTFWAKHGPCSKPGCGHRTPIFRSPVIAEKTLGVKYIELTCKSCKTVFHAELGDARMAPGAEHIVLLNETPFTALSQPFAQRLLEYGDGNKGEKILRAAELSERVENEPGLHCPKCGEFAGQLVRDVLTMHRRAVKASDIDKKHLKIQPARNSMKPVYCYLLIHPDWLTGSPGTVNGQELGGYSDATVDATALWYDERQKGLSLIEVRGRIKLSEDTSHFDVADDTAPDASSDPDDDSRNGLDENEAASDADDRRQYGVPRIIMLRDGRRIDTRKGTVPAKSTFTCQACGQKSDFLSAVKNTNPSYRLEGAGREADECPSCVAIELNYRTAPVSPYAIQGYCPECDAERQLYNGRFFSQPGTDFIRRLVTAETEWADRSVTDLSGFWPSQTIPHGLETHIRKPLCCWGYTHFHKMFLPNQLLLHAILLRAISQATNATDEVKLQALGRISCICGT